MISGAPPSGFQILQQTMRSLKREIIDAAVAELRRGLAGTFTASGQISAGSLGGTVPTTALPDLAGDVTGPPATNVVEKVQGIAISATDPTTGQVLTASSTSAAGWATPGSGAPTTAPYVTTAADAGLSAEKAIPYLADWNNRLQGSGYTWYDHFDDSSLDAAWTVIGTAADGPDESYYPGVLLISDTTNTTDIGVRRAVSLTANELAVVTKLAWTLNKADAYAGMVITDSADSALCTATFQRKTSDLQLRTGPAGATLVALPGYAWADEAYLMIHVATTAYTVYVSKHGFHPWHLVHSFTQAGTIARLRLIMNPQNHTYASSVMFDFAGAYPATALTYIGNMP